MVKKRTSGGGLGVILAQHFDTGVSLARRLTGQLFARFSQIGADSDPQIVTGTIGRSMGAFLMQLVASPSARPAYGHLWGVGGVPAIYNGDGTASPIFDAWANVDPDIAPLTVDIGPQSLAGGEPGAIYQGTFDDDQSLVFLAHTTGGSSGTGTAGWYGDGSDGALAFGKNTTNDPLVCSHLLVSQAIGVNSFGFATTDWVVFLCRTVFCTDLTIDAGVHVFAPKGVRCTGTLTINGELTCGGDAYGYLAANARHFVSPLQLGGGGGAVTTGINQSLNGGGGQAGSPPFWEGTSASGYAGNSALNSGSGGSVGFTPSGGSGAGGGKRGTLPGDTTNGDFATSVAIHALPYSGLVPGAGLGTFCFGGSSGGGGAAKSGPLVGDTARGGDGGAGGGVMIVCAKHIAGSGSITAGGGRGLPGVVAGAGQAGGGGGGNPGVVSVICDDITGVTTTATGGAGGAGAGGGSAGGAAGVSTGLVHVQNPSQ